MPALIVLRDGVVEYRVELGQPRLRIGRNRDNEVVLPDPGKAVSRVHAELRAAPGGYVLVDLDSQNGTWVDGRRIDSVDLRPGVAAAIGPFTLMLEGPEAVLPQPESRWGAARGAAAAPAPPAAARRAAAEPPPARRMPAAAPGRRPAAPEAPRGTGPIAWLARQPKPLVLAGFLVITLGAVGLVKLLASDPAPPPAAPSAAPGGGNTQAAAELVAQGRARLEQGDADAALAAAERALVIRPDDPGALELKLRAEEQRRAPRAPATGTPGGRR